MQFSKILKLNQFWSSNSGSDSELDADLDIPHYAILQELFLLRFEDKFAGVKKLFRSPVSLFYGHDDRMDVNSYISRLLNGFKDTYNKTALDLPIRKELFHMEIDKNNLFDNYSAQFHEQERKTPASQNYEREYAMNHLRDSSEGHPNTGPHFNHSDFSFNLVIYKKVGLCDFHSLSPYWVVV